MILAKPAENLTGVTAEGSFDDFYELTDSISGGCFCGFVCPGAFFMVETQLWSESQKAGKYDCVSAAQIRGLYQRHSGNRYTFGSDSWCACGGTR